MKLLLGPEVDAKEFVEMPQDVKHDAQWLLVTNKQIVNKTLAEIGLLENFSATVTRLKRKRHRNNALIPLAPCATETS